MPGGGEMSSPKLAGLLVRVDAGAVPSPAGLAAADAPLQALGFAGLEPLFEVPAGEGAGLGAAEATPAQWYRAPTAGVDVNPWDAVHAAASGLGLGAAGTGVYVEPDLVQTFLTTPFRAGLAAGDGQGTVDPPDRDLPFVDRFAWFLGDGLSQLGGARQAVGDPGEGQRVRIAHLDTGYDANHATRPPHLLTALQRNFVPGEDPADARDPGVDQLGPLDNPGHGTGTLSLLAGARVDPLNDFLGGAANAEIVPVRIAKSVVLLRTSSLAAALDHVSGGGPGGGRLADV